MARPTQIFLSGKIDNLIFYEFKGKPCVRKAPVKVHQTKATKGSAQLFGMAVSMSAALRKSLAKILPAKAIHKNMYLLNAALLNWLKEKRSKTPDGSDPLLFLRGLSFNEDCSLYSRLNISVIVAWSKTGNTKVRLPALTASQDIKAPAQTEALIWKIALASCTIGSASAAVQQATVEVEMPYDSHPAGMQSIELPFSIGKGELAVAVISLKYRVAKDGGTSLVTNSRWLPVDIVDAAYR